MRRHLRGTSSSEVASQCKMWSLVESVLDSPRQITFCKFRKFDVDVVAVGTGMGGILGSTSCKNMYPEIDILMLAQLPGLGQYLEHIFVLRSS